MPFLQEHPQPGKKQLANLKASMIKTEPFPKLSIKAAEAKNLLKPITCCLQDFKDQDPSQRDVLEQIVQVLEASHSIDLVVDSIAGFRPLRAQAEALQRSVLQMNIGMTKLCHYFHGRGLFLFNFVPKNHYLFHLAMQGRHMSPKLAWCYQGEDLMQKVKLLASSSSRGTWPRSLGNKILAKYLVGLDLAFADL